MSRPTQLKISIGDLLDANPPTDHAAEVALIGSLILDSAVSAPLVDEVGLDPSDFTKAQHGLIYDALREVYAKNNRLDMVMLVSHLVDKGNLEAIGGVDYLTECFESVPTALNADHYARRVQEIAKRRALIECAGKVLHRAYKTDADADDQRSEAEGELLAIGANRSPVGVMDRTAGMTEAYDTLDYEAEHGYIQGVRTGFHAVDEVVGGLRKSNLYLVAARPAMGKTAFALQLSEYAASTGTPTLFVSIEMPPVQVAKRLLAYSAGMNLERLRQPAMLGPDEWRQLRDVTDHSRNVPMWIMDAPSMNPATILSQAQRMQRQHGIGLVVIDYLQLMPKAANQNTATAVGDNAKACKTLARRLDCPVVLLSQLNRGVDKRDSRMPSMSDLRDSGEIEEAADVVMMLYRADYYRLQEDANAELDYEANVIVGKNRHGPAGKLSLSFKGGRFDNIKEHY